MFYLYSMASTIISLGSVVSGVAHLTPAQERYFASLGPLDYLGNFLGLAISGWAVIELFLLRQAAVRAFLVVLIMNLGLTAFHLLSTNWTEAIGRSGLFPVVVSWMVSAGVLIYAWALKRRHVLS